MNNTDLQTRVRKFESLNWLERNFTGPWGLTSTQKNEFYFANYWLDVALDHAQKGCDKDTVNRYLGFALEHAELSGVDFSKKLTQIKSCYQPSS
jgi:hypothetical protein